MPPTSANGTSLPSSAASSSRAARGRAQPPQVVAGQERRGAVRAAAGHPARDRDALVDVDRHPEVEAVVLGEQPGGADRDVRPVQRYVVQADPLVAGDGDRHVVGGRDGDPVVQADRLVDRRERVEPVLARRSHPEREVDLGRRAHRDAHRFSPSVERLQALGDQRELLDADRLAAGHRVDAGVRQGRLGRLGGAGQLLEGGAERLAALGERGVDDPEDVLAGGVDGRRVAVRPGHQPGVDVGHRPEHVAADRPGPSDVREPGGLDRGHAVGARPGGSGQPVGDLGLHHDQAVPQRGQQPHQVQEDRHGDVVGQVGDQRGGRRPRDLGDPQGVGLDDLAARGLVGGVGRDGAGQRGGQHRVELDGDHPGDPLEEREGQRAEARARPRGPRRRPRPRRRARSGARCSGR